MYPTTIRHETKKGESTRKRPVLAKHKVQQEEGTDPEDAAHDDRVAPSPGVDHADDRVQPGHLGSNAVHPRLDIGQARPLRGKLGPGRVRLAEQAKGLRQHAAHKRRVSPKARPGCSPEGVVGHPVTVVDSPSLREQRVGHGCPGRALESTVFATLSASVQRPPRRWDLSQSGPDLFPNRAKQVCPLFRIPQARLRKFVLISTLPPYVRRSTPKERTAPVSFGSRGGTLRARLYAVRGRGSPMPRAEGAPSRASWRVGRSGPRTVHVDGRHQQATQSRAPLGGERERPDGFGSGDSGRVAKRSLLTVLNAAVISSSNSVLRVARSSLTSPEAE